MPIYNYGLKWKFGVGARGQKGKQAPVHFGLQIGIYVLYGKDGKLMYVGRSGEGKHPNIAGRLNDHYRYGDKAGKWELFSWFGFIPVENGVVQVDGPISVADRDREIGDIEALLIHLLSPDWNGNGGSYTHMEEYKQVPD